MIICNEGREFERFQFRVNVYQQQSFPSSTLLFQLDRGSCFSNIHFTLSGKAGSPDANGIIRSIRKEEALQSQTLVRIRTSTISPNKEIPAGLRVSCASLSACPYFGLTLKYLRVRLYHFICFLQKQKNIGIRSIQEDTLCTRCFHFCEKKDLEVSQMRNFLTSFSSAENS